MKKKIFTDEKFIEVVESIVMKQKQYTCWSANELRTLLECRQDELEDLYSGLSWVHRRKAEIDRRCEWHLFTFSDRFMRNMRMVARRSDILGYVDVKSKMKYSVTREHKVDKYWHVFYRK